MPVSVLKKLALGFSAILVQIIGPVFLSINWILASFMTALLGASLWIYGYNGKVLIFVIIFSFLLSVEILGFFSYRHKKLFQHMWPHVLSVIARVFWIIFAATGLYDLIFYEQVWSFSAKLALGLDLWLLAYNLIFIIFGVLFCRKKFRDYFLNERWGEEASE